MATKARILPSELASFMGLKKGQAKQLKPYCEAAQDIVTAFARTDLDTSHAATMAMLMTAVWLQQTGANTVERFADLPLNIRYFIEVAKAG